MEWRKIEGFPNYSVSDEGLIRNNKFDRLLAFSVIKGGLTSYARVTLFKGNVRHYRAVHRLVAETFIPNPDNLPQVDHDDGNGLNNKVSNLVWMTGSSNVKKSFRQNPEVKLAICSQGGLLGGAVAQRKAEARYKQLLGDRFIKFHPSGELIKDAAVSYVCCCGVLRTASTMWKELRNHKGQCPVCTNTVARSNPSLR